MALTVHIKGTTNELQQLYSWEQLSKLIQVDYYKMHLVDGDEVFTITEEDLKRAGIIE